MFFLAAQTVLFFRFAKKHVDRLGYIEKNV